VFGVVAVGAAIAAVVVATTGGHAAAAPTDDPGAFAVDTVRKIVQNRYADAWDTLHPVDKSVAPKREYVRCENRSRFTATFVRARVGHVGDESVGLGNGRFVDSKAVEVLVTLRAASAPRFVVRHTVHLVVADGKWTWILPAWRYGYFRDDICPTSPSAPASPS